MWLDTQETPHRGRGGLMYPSATMRISITRNDVLIVSSLHPIKKEKGKRESDAEQFLFDNFVKKKMIHYPDISKKLITGTFSSSSSFSNSSNSRGKTSNISFHRRTQCFFGERGSRSKGVSKIVLGDF